MNFNRIISFGDSFTRGAELSDCVDIPFGVVLSDLNKYAREYEVIKSRKAFYFGEADIDGKRPQFEVLYSLSTWPALIAKNMNVEYRCLAYSGCSNQTIIRTLTKFINELTPNDLVIIDWTFSNRWDYLDLEEPNVDRNWKTIRPSGNQISEINEFYFKYLQSDEWNKWESLRAIMLATHLLKSRNIKYFMTCEDELIFDDKFHRPTYIKNCQDEVKNDIFWFDNNGFYNWSVNNNFPLGKQNNHPLEEAHRAAFEYIIKNYEFA